ncbi:MAG: hypothetical protein V2A34_16455 [Lentisphaerota bacterium]
MQTLSREAAQKEAARCLDCDRMCSICTSVCPNRAILTYETDSFAAPCPLLKKEGAKAVPSGVKEFTATQPYQIAILTDFCNECGNCATFCPTDGKPYADKPRLYLQRKEFLEQEDNAFMAYHESGTWAMQGRFAGATHSIILNEELLYLSPEIKASLDPCSFRVKESSWTPQAKEGTIISLEPCAILLRLLTGVRESLPYLPTARSEEAALF